MQISQPVRKRLAAALIVLLSGCSKTKDATPESAVREMIKATRIGDAARAYALLAPQSRQRLEQMARLASAQTGGQRTVSPQELIQVSLDPVPHRLGRIEVIEQQAGRARLRLLSSDGKAQQQVTLVRVKGAWRIVLPERAFGAPARASVPARLPAQPTR